MEEAFNGIFSLLKMQAAGVGIGSALGFIAKAVLDHLLARRKFRTETLITKQHDTYGKLLAKLRVTPLLEKSIEAEESVHGLINEVITFTEDPEVMDVIKLIGNALQKGKYWDTPMGTERLIRLENAMRRELGRGMPIVRRLTYRCTDKFKGILPNEYCPCRSGKKFKKCHGK